MALAASTATLRVGSTLHSMLAESTVTDSNVMRISGEEIVWPSAVSSVTGEVT